MRNSFHRISVLTVALFALTFLAGKIPSPIGGCFRTLRMLGGEAGGQSYQMHRRAANAEA